MNKFQPVNRLMSTGYKGYTVGREALLLSFAGLMIPPAGLLVYYNCSTFKWASVEQQQRTQRSANNPAAAQRYGGSRYGLMERSAGEEQGRSVKPRL